MESYKVLHKGCLIFGGAVLVHVILSACHVIAIFGPCHVILTVTVCACVAFPLVRLHTHPCHYNGVYFQST